ncbi:uncharacterized protein LOC111693436, partial [Trichogramma pretiosum]|uniref:uncharacterized protein LOC111693436 n=1 Tax=Trichogramma pretiosum TaxID=7493 RepID=UPI000C71A875
MNIEEDMSLDVWVVNEDSQPNTAESSLSKISPQLIEKYSKQAWLDGKFFVLEADKSDVNSICGKCQFPECEKDVRGAPDVSSNFVKHLKRHSNAIDEYKAYKRFKDSNPNASQKVKRVTCSLDQKKFEENVVRCILDNMLAFRIVETASFRAIFSDLEIKCGDESLKTLSRAKVVKTADALIAAQKNEIKNILKSVYHVCLTADIWSSPTRSFMGVTAHWINHLSLLRKSAVLACRRFQGSHSHDKVTDILAEINQEFDLDNNKVIGTVTDNGSNFVKAFE